MRQVRIGMGVLAIAVVAACSDNGSGPGGTADLSGTYDLVSLRFGLLSAPGSSGSLAFTADSFQAVIQVVSPDTTIVPDTSLTLLGSYLAKINPDSLYLVLPMGLGTIGGTYQIAGAQRDTLVLNLVFPASPQPIPLNTVWHKQ
jgi:hypothetical protein